LCTGEQVSGRPRDRLVERGDLTASINRDSDGCRPPRHAWASAPAGTVGGCRRSSARRVSATRRPTLLYAHHDRGSAASMVIVVRLVSATRRPTEPCAHHDRATRVLVLTTYGPSRPSREQSYGRCATRTHATARTTSS